MQTSAANYGKGGQRATIPSAGVRSDGRNGIRIIEATAQNGGKNATMDVWLGTHQTKTSPTDRHPLPSASLVWFFSATLPTLATILSLL